MKAILEGALIQTNTGTGYLHLYEDGAITGFYLAQKTSDGKSVKIERDSGETKGLHSFVANVVRSRQLFKTKGDVDTVLFRANNTEIRSLIATPLISGVGEIFGVLTLLSPHAGAFDDEAEETLNILAAQAVIAIQNARNYARAEIELKRFSQLYNTAWELAQITDPSAIDKAYENVLRSADVSQQSQAFICRFDEDTQALVIGHSLRLRDEIKSRRIGLDEEGVNAQVARERKPVIIYDTEHLPTGVVPPKPLDMAVNSLVVIPLEFGDRYYGNLALSHERANYFRDADVELIKGLAKQLAITIYRLETAEARTEAEQRAMEAEVMSSVGQSTIELSHRLANDLGLTTSYVNNVRRELKSADISLPEVNSNLDKIIRDVQMVLDLSKGLKKEVAGLRAEGVNSRDCAAISVRNLLREIAASYPGLPNTVKIRFDIRDDVRSVWGVLTQVKDTLRNLFVNAVEALPDGGSITLGAHNSGENVNLEIKDSGPGIEPARLPRIFDLFYSTKGGFGFGLWSARRNALANGGDLKVDSKAGVGTTFTLSLRKGPQETR